ncbi:hypothetical protein [Geobacillus thermoleovorans]|uniref:hypothetical protein n=1 Tax=Geobacillus thermoleovorans TaxID=33941 RepID=UPI003DA5D2B0
MINQYFQKINEHLELVLSGNIEGADEHNRRWVEKYKERIPVLVEGHQLSQ